MFLVAFEWKVSQGGKYTTHYGTSTVTEKEYTVEVSSGPNNLITRLVYTGDDGVGRVRLCENPKEARLLAEKIDQEHIKSVGKLEWNAITNLRSEAQNQAGYFFIVHTYVTDNKATLVIYKPEGGYWKLPLTYDSMADVKIMADKCNYQILTKPKPKKTKETKEYGECYIANYEEEAGTEVAKGDESPLERFIRCQRDLIEQIKSLRADRDSYEQVALDLKEIEPNLMTEFYELSNYLSVIQGYM
jgi:hypothetical protein